MKIFISWSGEKSRYVAEKLSNWLPKIIQRLEVWISCNDIEKGKRWSTKIDEKLEHIDFGIICLTHENRVAPWILFEAGALSKRVEGSHVCPLLIDLEEQDVTGPLSKFQHTKLQKDDILKLLKTINQAIGDACLDDQRLQETFETFWPQLKQSITSIPSDADDTKEERSHEDMTIEILEIVRGLSRNITNDPLNIRQEGIGERPANVYSGLQSALIKASMQHPQGVSPPGMAEMTDPSDGTNIDVNKLKR